MRKVRVARLGSRQDEVKSEKVKRDLTAFPRLDLIILPQIVLAAITEDGTSAAFYPAKGGGFVHFAASFTRLE